ALAVLVSGLLLIQIGFAWDAQWHIRWVRDAFWMPPHLMVYAAASIIVGSLAGIVSRLTREDAPFTPMTRLQLRAPRGVLLGAAGAAALAACGPADQLWHAAFGQDFGLWSPPHLAINLSLATVMTGTTLALSDYRHIATSRIARRLASAAMLLTLGMLFNNTSTVTLQALMPGVREATPAGTLLHAALVAGTIPIAIIAGHMALGRAAGSLGVLGASLFMRLVGTVFAGTALAATVRLAGGSLGEPRALTIAPSAWAWLLGTLYLHGLIVLFALTVGRSGPITRRRATAAGMVGALGALLMALAAPGLRFGVTPVNLAVAVVLALALGAAGGWLGRRLGTLLAHQNDAPQHSPVDRPAAVMRVSGGV
ncbi:MAG: hypothetical protein NTZ05_22895, partial [Chloroflexi bacterium]|nr:hypothetical protein [Chloroflexota bacterium]